MECKIRVSPFKYRWDEFNNVRGLRASEKCTLPWNSASNYY